MEVRPADGERQRCACGEGGGGTRWDAGLGAPECLGQLQRSASARRSRIPRAPEGLCHGGEQPRAAGEHRGLRHRGRKEVMLRSCHRNRIYPSLQLQSAAQHGLLQPPPLPPRVGGGHTPLPPPKLLLLTPQPGGFCPPALPRARERGALLPSHCSGAKPCRATAGPGGPICTPSPTLHTARAALQHQHRSITHSSGTDTAVWQLRGKQLCQHPWLQHELPPTPGVLLPKEPELPAALPHT